MILDIGPWKVSVLLVPQDTIPGSLGEWDLTTRTITILETLPPLDLSMALIHEVLHCLSDLYHLRLSEQSVRCLENSITSLIQSHPDLANLLIRAITTNTALFSEDSDATPTPPA